MNYPNLLTAPFTSDAVIASGHLLRHARGRRTGRCGLVLALILLPILSAFGGVRYTRVMALGDLAPGTGGQYFHGPGHHQGIPIAAINNRGEVVFVTGLTDGNIGIWKWSAGEIRLVARTGQPAPGTTDSFVNLLGVNLNDAGDVAFYAVAQASPQDPFDQPLYVDRGEGPVKVETPVQLQGEIAFSDAGVACRSADFTRLFFGWPGAMKEVVRAGDDAPGIANAKFVKLGSPQLNQLGQIAFAASVTAGSQLANGVWVWTDGQLRLAYRYGTRPAGLPAGLNIATGNLAYIDVVASQPLVRINIEGKVAVWAHIRRADNPNGLVNGNAVLVESGGQMNIVAGYGMDVPGRPGAQFGQLDNFLFNDLGQVAFSALGGTWVGQPGDLLLVAPEAPGLYPLFPVGLSGNGQLFLSSFWESTCCFNPANPLRQEIWMTDAAGALQQVAKYDSPIPVGISHFHFSEPFQQSGGGDGRARSLNDLGEGVFSALERIEFATGGFGFAETLVVAQVDPPQQPIGDLLVKRGSESDAKYGLDNVYQRIPAGAQIRTNTVGLNKPSEFQVQIQNDGDVATSLRLHAKESTNEGWRVEYLFGGTDISTALRTGAGGDFPQLGVDESHIITVRMTPTNVLPDSRKSTTLFLGNPAKPNRTIDAVACVSELALELVVNSTADLPAKDPFGCCCDTGRKLADGQVECTLRAAIQISNSHPGKDIIYFNVPSTDPNYTLAGAIIAPLEALPDITSPVRISAEAQSPSAQGLRRVVLSGAKIKRPRPPAHGGMVVVPWLDVLSWEGAASGLTLLAKSDVHDLVIHSFPLCGVLIKAPGCQVMGCYIGTALDGNSGLPNGLGAADTTLIRGCGIGIQSSGNWVYGNLISGGIPAGLADSTKFANPYSFQEPPGLVIQGTAAFGNEVVANRIGTTQDGSRSVVDWTLLQARSGMPVAGVLIDGAPNNSIGSYLTENVISGNAVGVYIFGPNATGNAVYGNFIGTDAAGRIPIPNGVGIFLDDAPGNTIGDSKFGSSNWIAGNDFGILVEGPNARDNIIERNTVGAFLPPRGVFNWFGNGHGIDLGQDSSRTLVTRNRIRSNQLVGIMVRESSVNRIIGNTVDFNGWPDAFACAGIVVESGSANLMSRNEILYNGRFSGIQLGPPSRRALANDDQDADEGPNGLQNHPSLGDYDVFTLGSDLRIVGELSTTPSGGTYVLEFFTGSFLPTGSRVYGDAEHFLGAADVTVDASGLAKFNLSFPRPIGALAKYVTATATARDGSTSELCHHATIYPCRELDADGNCAEVEEDCPPGAGLLPGPSLQGMTPRTPQQASPATGDGNGDGVPDSRQANVASLPTQPGVWITLTQADGTRFQNVRARGTPGLSDPPSELAFPLAFLRFGLTNVPRGGALTVTNYLHLDATPESDYQATTYLNYGATPDDPQPHWYEFLYDGSTGAELFPDRILLHFRDGGRGDGNLAANGGIVTFGGPAYLTPSGPRLELWRATVSLLDGKTTQIAANGTSVTVASQVPVVTSVLAWPADATNHALYFKGDIASNETRLGANGLARLDLWQPVPDSPALVNEWLVVTNSALGSSGFYQLEERPGAVLDRMTPQRLAGGIYTWIGEGTWSVATNWESTALTLGPPPLDGLTTVGIVFVPGATPVVSTVDGAYSVLGLTVSGGSTGVELQAGTPGARLVLGAGGLAHLAAGNTVLQPDLALGAGQFWRVDTGTLSLAALDLGPRALTTSGAGRLVVRALAGDPSSRFAAIGEGPVELADAAPGSSFRGTLAIAGGGVTVSEGLFQGAGAFEVTGGSLILPSQASLNSLSPVSLSGGGIVRNAANGHLGPLQLGGEGALWLGSGTGSLSFVSATVAGTGARLTVHDWQGTGGASGTGAKLFLETAPDPALLAKISFIGAGFDTGALRLATGEIVPIGKATSVFPADALNLFQAYGTGLTKTIVAVSGQAFSQAMRVDTTQKPAQAYNSGVVLRTSQAVAANDNLLARFWIRRVAPASGTAQVQFNFELASGSFEKSVQFPVSLNNDQWQLKSVKFKSKAAYAAGAAEVSFWAGYGVQTVEIGGLEVLNYRGTTPP
ncbi:MAG: nitrous oxide reductase family maturation protein NosD [Verrucomicrobiia bacterium]